MAHLVHRPGFLQIALIVVLVLLFLLVVDAAMADPTTSCAAPTVTTVLSLPFVDQEDGTCDGPWDTDVDCLGDWSTGQSSFYRIDNDSGVAVVIRIEFTSHTTWTGLAGFASCADPTTCQFVHTANSSTQLDVVEQVPMAIGGSLLLRIGQFAPPDCTSYDLVVTVVGAENDDCAGAEADAVFRVEGVGSWNGDTSTVSVSDEYSGIGGAGVGDCSGTDGVGPDLVYWFDVTNGAGSIDLELDSPGWAGVLWVTSDCGVPVAGAVGCSATTEPALLSLSGLADGRYFVIVDGSSGDAGPFELRAPTVGIPVELMSFSVE